MTYAWIIAGAIVGAPLRYFVGSHAPGNWGSFPAGTLLVNASGCLLIGLVLGLGEARGALSREVRLLVVTGFLGSYTTSAPSAGRPTTSHAPTRCYEPSPTSSPASPGIVAFGPAPTSPNSPS